MGNCIDIFLKSKTNNMEYKEMKGTYRAKVVAIHKADFISVIICKNFIFEKYRLVMGDYYIPTISTSSKTITKLQEFKKIENSIMFLKKIILDKIVDLEIIGYDNSGNLMGNIILKNENLCDIMISNGYAYPYLTRN
jgi:hypothetical protein